MREVAHVYAAILASHGGCWRPVFEPAKAGEKQKSPLHELKRASKNNPGSDLLSHAPTHAVPSAEADLTSVFGMGTGVALPL